MVEPTPPSDLRLQWTVTTGVPAESEGSRILSLDHLHVRVWAPLKVHDVCDASGTRVGILLGDPVNLRTGRVVDGQYVMGVPVSGRDVDEVIEQEIYQVMAGRWVFILDHGDTQRIYLDAAGTLSAVFEGDARIVGATTAAILDPEAYATRFRRDLYTHLQILQTGWFPAPLTAHHGVGRIPANHYLDLSDFSLHRHWPVENPVETDDPERTGDEITAIVQQTSTALAREGGLVHTLTGGLDSRYLLATSLPVIADAEYVTIASRGAERDVALAQSLAALSGIKHTVLPERLASSAEQQEWHRRTGHCVGGSTMASHKSLESIDGIDKLVVGLGGEVARAFFWKPSDTRSTKLTGEALEGRLGMPPHPQVRAVLDDWLPGVAHFDTFTILDLAYLELRLSPWAYVRAYTSAGIWRASPMTSRGVYERMLALPPSWRRSSRVMKDQINRLCPDLARVPYNQYGDFRDKLMILKHVLRDPSSVPRKIRRLMSS